MNRIADSILRSNSFKMRNIDRVQLVLGQVHIELYKIRPSSLQSAAHDSNVLVSNKVGIPNCIYIPLQFPLDAALPQLFQGFFSFLKASKYS